MELYRSQIFGCDPLEYARGVLQGEYQGKHDEAESVLATAERRLRTALHEEKMAREAMDPTSAAAIRLASSIADMCSAAAKTHAQWITTAVLDHGGQVLDDEGFTSRACALVSAIRQASPVMRRAGSGVHALGCALYPLLRHRVLTSLAQGMSAALQRQASDLPSCIKNQVSAVTDVVAIAGPAAAALVECIMRVWRNVYGSEAAEEVEALLRDALLAPLAALFSLCYSLIGLEPLGDGAVRAFRPAAAGAPVHLSRFGFRLLSLPSASAVAVLREMETAQRHLATLFPPLTRVLVAAEPGDDLLVSWALRGCVRLPSGATVFPAGPVIPPGELTAELRALVRVPLETSLPAVYGAAFDEYVREMALQPPPKIPAIPDYVSLNGVQVFECTARLICALSHLPSLISVSLPSCAPTMWNSLSKALAEHRTVLTRLLQTRPLPVAALALLAGVLMVGGGLAGTELTSEQQHWRKLRFMTTEYISRTTAAILTDRRGSLAPGAEAADQLSAAVQEIAAVTSAFGETGEQVLTSIQKSLLQLVDTSLANELRSGGHERRPALQAKAAAAAAALQKALPVLLATLPSGSALNALPECCTILDA